MTLVGKLVVARERRIVERKSWDEHFLDVAAQVAEMGTCSRLKVGAVIIKDKRIISTGFNGKRSILK